MRTLTWVTLVLASLATGCAATIGEQHFFASYRPEAPDKPVNFFRLSVNGHSGMSNARYLAGFYDERALDLFFNEMKAPTNQKLFDESAKLPGAESGEKFRPLTANAADGAYVLILSTNADSVANAIGSFAESQVVAQALTQLINKDRIKDKARSDVEVSASSSRSKVLVAKLRGHLTEAQNAASADDARASYLRALHALSQALGNRDSSFVDFKDAKRWFDLELAQQVSAP